MTNHFDLQRLETSMTTASPTSFWSRLSVGQKLATIPLLFAIAILGVLAYTVITAQDQQFDSFIMDMATRQRMLVQRAAGAGLARLRGGRGAGCQRGPGPGGVHQLHEEHRLSDHPPPGQRFSRSADQRRTNSGADNRTNSRRAGSPHGGD